MRPLSIFEILLLKNPIPVLIFVQFISISKKLKSHPTTIVQLKHPHEIKQSRTQVVPIYSTSISKACKSKPIYEPSNQALKKSYIKPKSWMKKITTLSWINSLHVSSLQAKYHRKSSKITTLLWCMLGMRPCKWLHQSTWMEKWHTAWSLHRRHFLTSITARGKCRCWSRHNRNLQPLP